MAGDSRIRVRAPESGGEEHLVAEPLNVAAKDLPSSTTERQATVLFVSGSTKLYETAGDTTALEAISRCLALAARATQESGGRVVKTIGDELMGIFASADAAANAAVGMQGKLDSLPEVSGTKLGMHIGFQHGPVLQRGDDVFGDTVNMARGSPRRRRGARSSRPLTPLPRSAQSSAAWSESSIQLRSRARPKRWPSQSWYGSLI
jgi:adenylate cyclase